MAIYAVVRVAILLASGPSDNPGISTAAWIVGVFVTLPLMAECLSSEPAGPGALKPASTLGSICTSCRPRTATLHWHCWTALPPPPDATETHRSTKAGLI